MTLSDSWKIRYCLSYHPEPLPPLAAIMLSLSKIYVLISKPMRPDDSCGMLLQGWYYNWSQLGHVDGQMQTVCLWRYGDGRGGKLLLENPFVGTG